MWTEIAVWCLTSLLVLTGLAGVIVPILPGTTLLLAAGALHAWLLPGTIGATVLWILAGLWVVSIIAEIVATLLGTRLFGGSKWGMAGASGGALLGLFWGPIRGAVLGSLLGAIAGEGAGGQRQSGTMLRAGMGAGVGFVLGTIAKGVCAAAMTVVLLWAAIAP